MKKKLIAIFSIIAVILVIAGLYIKSIMVQPTLSSNLEFQSEEDSEIVDSQIQNDWNEYIEVFGNQSESSESSTYSLDKEIQAYATVEYVGFYTKNSDTVKCRVTAPDLNTFIISNEEQLMQLEQEELYARLIEYIHDPESVSTTVELELPAASIDGQLVVASESFEFQDAIHGGLYSAMTQIYIQAFNEMIEFYKEGQ